MQGQYRGDFTRDTFNPLNQFSRVLMQQGRVQIDADWNEQTSILLHYLRSLAADLIGQHGGPIQNSGFAITSIPGVSNDFRIGSGNYYVDGILCESNPAPTAFSDAKDNNGQAVVIIAPDETGYCPDQYVEIVGQPGSIAQILDVEPTPSGIRLTLSQSIANLGINPGIKGPWQLRRVITYRSQPDFPVTKDDGIQTIQLPDNQNRSRSVCLVYLDVWERHLSSIEVDGIREVALNGPDTASRAKVVCQVRIAAPTTPSAKLVFDTAIAGMSNNDPLDKVGSAGWRDFVINNLQAENRGLLKAQVQPQRTSTDPCVISAESHYRRAENQLYRVEIHRGTDIAISPPPPATFKWSRENGSVSFPVLKLAPASGQTKVTLGSFGPDEKLGLNEGDWVEIWNDDYTLLNRPEPLLKVLAIDRTSMSVTLDGVTTGKISDDPTKHPLLRRWESKGDVTIDAGKWIDLEDGIQIQFLADPNPTYRTGDYWLIPARVATGNIEWPLCRDAQGQALSDPTSNEPIAAALPPHGVQHSYAPLAVIDLSLNQGAAIPFGVFDERLFFSQTVVNGQRLFGPLAQKTA